MTPYFKPLILTSAVMMTACAQEANAQQSVDTYRSAIIAKCTDDGEMPKTCACAFDSWSNELGSKTSPNALAAARMLSLKDGETPASNDIMKGVRDLQKMSIAIAACADIADKESSSSVQDSFALARGIEEELAGNEDAQKALGVKKEQTSSVVDDMLARAMSGDIGGGSGEEEAAIRDTLEMLGQGDMVTAMGGADGTFDMQDLQRMDDHRNAQLKAKQQAESEAYNQQTNQPSQLAIRHADLMERYSSLNPTTQPVASYEEVHKVNCRFDEGSEAFCGCSWNVLTITLSGKDDDIGRTAAYMASLPAGDISGVSIETRQKAFPLLETHMNLKQQKCSSR